MHPILFHIPLPKTQVAALYFYLAAIALGLIYAAAQWFVWKSKANALGGPPLHLHLARARGGGARAGAGPFAQGWHP